jgi:quercetin dioxygenase-like cupin family protein
MKKAFAATALVVAPILLAQEPLAPAIDGPPTVTPAPGRGIMPSVSAHSAAMPVLYALDAQTAEQISPLVRRQYLGGSQSTFVKWTIKAGGHFPLHHHAYEQTTWIVSGRCDVYSQGQRFEMRAGMVLVIPPNVPHEFTCPVDTVDIDFFAPARQDWADGIASVATIDVTEPKAPQ